MFVAASMNPAEAAFQSKLIKPPADMLDKHSFIISLAITRLLSVGSVYITSADPKKDLAIDPAYLTYLADVEMLAKGIGAMLRRWQRRVCSKRILRGGMNCT